MEQTEPTTTTNCSAQWQVRRNRWQWSNGITVNIYWNGLCNVWSVLALPKVTWKSIRIAVTICQRPKSAMCWATRNYWRDAATTIHCPHGGQICWPQPHIGYWAMMTKPKNTTNLYRRCRRVSLVAINHCRWLWSVFSMRRNRCCKCDS